MNAFARSNLSVALLRLHEAKEKARCAAVEDPGNQFLVAMCETIGWSVREAMRLIEAATAVEDMQSADTLPAPDSETRKVGG